jgi:hypothetical protein
MTTLRPAPLVRLLLILPLLALVGCDSITGNDDDDITGTWTAQRGASTEFLVVTDSDLTVYTRGTGDTCFRMFRFDILSSSGDTYTLREVGSTFTADLVIRRSGDDLQVVFEGGAETVTYRSTSTDASDLDVCTGGGEGDTSVACTELDQVEVGSFVTGTLSTSDKVAPSGAYYDMYGLQLAAQQEVQIDLSSNEFDTYLYLYESDGTLVDSNDDFGDELDSSLTVTLTAGCYRIEASSYGAGETGAYSLSVN